MDDEPIQKLLNEIDRLPTDDEPRSRILPAHPPCFVFVEANKAALILFARYFLAAAAAPAAFQTEDVGGKIIDVFDKPVTQILQPKGRIGIGWIKRVPAELLSDESVARTDRLERRTGLLMKLGIGVIVFFFLFLLVSGAGLWIGVLFGNLR